MQNRDRNYKDYHGPPRDSRTPADSRRDPNYARQNGPVRRGPYQPGGPYGPGPGPGPHGGPYPVLGPPHVPPGPHTHALPWNFVGGPVAAHPLAQYPYAPGPVAYPPADALSFPPPGMVWQQPPPAAWQQPQSVEFPGQSLPWQQQAQMQQAAQVQQEEDPPPPPPPEEPPGPPPDPAESAAAAPTDELASRLMDGAVPPLPEDAIRAVSMEVDQQPHATAKGDRSETAAGEQAALEREAGSEQPDAGSGQQRARGPQEEPSMTLNSKKITTAPAELQPVSGGTSPAVSSQPNPTVSSPLKQTRPSFLKSNPPFLMTLKRRTAASIGRPSSGRSTPQAPEAPGASTPQPVQILADDGGAPAPPAGEAPAPPAGEAPAPQQNGDAPPKEEPAQRKRRRWDDAPIASPSAGAPLQGTPLQIAPPAKAQTPGRTPKKSLEERTTKSRRRNQERGRGVTRSPSADGRSSSSSRTSSGDGTSTSSSTSGRDSSESPNRSRRRGAPQHRARARDSRSPAERTPSRRTDRLRSRPRSRSPYRSSQLRRWHRRSRTRSRSRERSRHQSARISPDRRHTPYHPPSRRRSPIRHPSRSPVPSKPARLTQPSRRRSRTPQRHRESALSPALLEEHDGDDDEVPPPPPDEPFPGELELQEEMEVIAGMDQRIQARIVDIAAQYGCEFNNLDIHGCRDFCETLYAHVYPEHPDFTAWDASDAAELAAMQEEATAGDVHFPQALPDISDIKLGPAPLELEDRPLLEVSEIPVPLSPDEQAAKDPRNRPEPGELELEEPPLLLPVPLFALGPPEPSAVLGGDWEEDSVLSWSESPRLAGLTEEIESNKVVAPDEAQGEVMQAPAAPRHETIVRDDDRDWTKEQMARAQEQAATSLPRGPPKAPEKGGDWSWIEVHSHRGFGLTSRLYPLMDLRGWAEERRYGLQFGVSVYRQTDGLWLPLTEKPVQPEDLEWGGAGHTPLHAGSEEALRDPQAATVQVMTAPERDAAAMSDEAAWQWVEEASALPCALPTANGSIAGHAVQDGLKDAGDASPSGTDTLDVFGWFDEESSLKRLSATIARVIARVRMKEEAAKKGRRAAAPDMSAADSGGGHRLWGGPPPPQHGAMLRGKLATAVLSGAVGKTIVAEIIGKAARAVLENRAAEVEARQVVQQARRAQRPAKPATPEQKGRGHGKASKSHHGKEAALASADRKRDAVQGKSAAGRETNSTDRHGQLRDGGSAQERGSDWDRKTPIKTESRSASVPHQSAPPKGDRAAEQAKTLAVEASGKTEPHGSSPALKETRVKVKSEQKSLPVKTEPHESMRHKSQAQRAGGSDADWEPRSGAVASADKGPREKARKVQPKSRRLKHILDEDGSDGNELQSGDDAGGAAETANPRKRQRVHKTASLDAFQAHPMSAGPSAGGVSVTTAEAGPGQVQTPAEVQCGRPEHQEGKAAQKHQAGVLRTAESEGRGHERAARSEDRAPKGAKKKGQKRQLQDEDFEVDEEERPKGRDDDEEEDDEEKEQRQKAEQEKERRRMEALEQHRQKQSLEAFDNIIRALAKRDKQIDGVFMNPVDTKEFDSYLDIVKQPICIKDIMRKNKDKKYPPNKDGLDALVADVKLMCDNCRLFNKDGEAASEYIGYADEMEEHVRETAELEWKKTSKMIGGRRV